METFNHYFFETAFLFFLGYYLVLAVYYLFLGMLENIIILVDTVYANGGG